MNYGAVCVVEMVCTDGWHGWNLQGYVEVLFGGASGRDGLTWDGWGRDTRGPEGLVGKCMCRVVV
jgi:hypothetical protein